MKQGIVHCPSNIIITQASMFQIQTLVMYQIVSFASYKRTISQVVGKNTWQNKVFLRIRTANFFLTAESMCFRISTTMLIAWRTRIFSYAMSCYVWNGAYYSLKHYLLDKGARFKTTNLYNLVENLVFYVPKVNKILTTNGKLSYHDLPLTNSNYIFRFKDLNDFYFSKTMTQ